MCGADSGVSVVWLELDAKLKVISRKAVTLVECVTNPGLSKWAGQNGNDVMDSADPKLRMVAGKLESNNSRLFHSISR
jgi:hypothetical protein